MRFINKNNDIYQCSSTSLQYQGLQGVTKLVYLGTKIKGRGDRPSNVMIFNTLQGKIIFKPVVIAFAIGNGRTSLRRRDAQA